MLIRALAEGLTNIPGVTVYGPADPTQRTATVSFTVADRRVSEIGLRLDEEHDRAVPGGAALRAGRAPDARHLS